MALPLVTVDFVNAKGRGFGPNGPALGPAGACTCASEEIGEQVGEGEGKIKSEEALFFLNKKKKNPREDVHQVVLAPLLPHAVYFRAGLARENTSRNLSQR